MKKAGSLVQKIHPYDGSRLAGKKLGKLFEVVQIVDFSPVDAQPAEAAVALLSDGTWQFVWNLHWEREVTDELP